MAWVDMDLVEESYAYLNANGWLEHMRVAFVGGMDLSQPAAYRYIQCVSMLPVIGTAHETMALLWLWQINADRPEGADCIRAKLDYKWGIPLPNPLIIRSVQYSSQAMDITTYNYPQPPYTPLTVTYLGVTYPASVTIKYPLFQMTITKEQGSTDPINTVMTYVGTVNSQTYVQGSPGTWLCSGINCVQNTVQSAWMNSYVFTFNPIGWQPFIRYRDPGTGWFPSDPSNPPTQIQWYSALDFTQLHI